MKMPTNSKFMEIARREMEGRNMWWDEKIEEERRNFAFNMYMKYLEFERIEKIILEYEKVGRF